MGVAVALLGRSLHPQVLRRLNRMVVFVAQSHCVPPVRRIISNDAAVPPCHLTYVPDLTGRSLYCFARSNRRSRTVVSAFLRRFRRLLLLVARALQHAGERVVPLMTCVFEHPLVGARH